jgi:hypothetical protein
MNPGPRYNSTGFGLADGILLEISAEGDGSES